MAKLPGPLSDCIDSLRSILERQTRLLDGLCAVLVNDRSVEKLRGAGEQTVETNVAAAVFPMVQAIGAAMFCPYEGDTPPERVMDIIERLWPEGVRSFYLAVSVGLDDPRAVNDLCARVKDRWPELVLGLHLHNTNGMALASALTAAEAGAEFFEGSICGIGGGIRMPYGMAPYGNVATEDLVHMFNECGVDTGLDTMTVIDAARRIKDLLELENTHSYALQGAVKQIVLDQGRTAPRND